jgi:hypothetical protein
VRLTLVPGANWSTTYKRARASGEAPGTPTSRIPMLSAPKALEGVTPDADALLAGAIVPANSNNAIRRPRTRHSRFAYATEWVMVAE